MTIVGLRLYRAMLQKLSWRMRLSMVAIVGILFVTIQLLYPSDRLLPFASFESINTPKDNPPVLLV